MNTKTAIEILTTLSQNLGAEANKILSQQTAVDVAIAQLKELLDTPSVDLQEANTTIDTLQQRVNKLENPSDNGETIIQEDAEEPSQKS